MKLSTRARYGVRALCALAVLSADGAAVPVSTVAEHERLSRQYLSVIFHELRKAGFVRTERGARGGYLLARPADQISVAQLVTLLDGPVAPVGCVLSPCDDPDSRCTRKNDCFSRPAWVKLQGQIEQALSDITIASLASVAPKMPHRAEVTI